MNNPMDGKKDPTFKCPSCGELLSVETKGESDSEHSSLGKKSSFPKANAATMPMDQLKSNITPPNLNSY